MRTLRIFRGALRKLRTLRGLTKGLFRSSATHLRIFCRPYNSREPYREAKRPCESTSVAGGEVFAPSPE